MPGGVHGYGQAVHLYCLGQFRRTVEGVSFVLGRLDSLFHRVLLCLLSGVLQGGGDGEGPADEQGVHQSGDGAGIGRPMRPWAPLLLLDGREPAGMILEPQRLPVAGDVVDVDVLAGHVGQELRPIGGEGHIRRGDGRNPALAHRVEVCAGIGDVPGAEIGQVAGHRPLLDLPDRLCQSHDAAIVETDVGIEGSHGHLLGADRVNGDALALGAGGAGVAARLQVEDDVATRSVSAAAVRLPDVQLSAWTFGGERKPGENSWLVSNKSKIKWLL